jgi:linoleoyl-CoA desaturase
MKYQQPVRFVNRDKTQFYKVLKSKVDLYFNENGISRYGNTTMYIKTITLLCAYIIPFIFILSTETPYWVDLLMWSLMGFASAGIGMSIMHDANHGSYSSNSKINYVMGHTLNILGGSVFNWKLQHNLLHHTYTNIAGWDEDIKDKFGLKFTPHSESKKIHRLQWIYAFVLYAVVTLYWSILKDFLQFSRYIKEGVNQSTQKTNRWAFAKIFLNKLIYFSVMLVIPVFIFNIPFIQVLTGFVIMHLITGFVLTVTFQLAHTVEGTTHPLPDESGNIENEWAIHQLNTTANFARNNKWLSWYVGGLNYQIEHHLFPGICHVHYPAIAPIVKETAESFGLEYLENESLGSALKSHIKLLKRFGNHFSLNDALG